MTFNDFKIGSYYLFELEDNITRYNNTMIFKVLDNKLIDVVFDTDDGTCSSWVSEENLTTKDIYALGSQYGNDVTIKELNNDDLLEIISEIL